MRDARALNIYVPHVFSGIIIPPPHAPSFPLAPDRNSNFYFGKGEGGRGNFPPALGPGGPSVRPSFRKIKIEAAAAARSAVA